MAKNMMPLVAALLLVALALQPPAAMARAGAAAAPEAGGEKAAGGAGELFTGAQPKRTKTSMAELFAAKEVCVRGCAKLKDPSGLVACEDNCAVETEFKSMLNMKEQCVKECDEEKKDPATTDVCRKSCDAFVDGIFVNLVAASPCFHKCGPKNGVPNPGEPMPPEAGACIKKCMDAADAADKKLIKETAAAVEADPNCFERCGKEGGGDQDRVHSCKDACPLAKLAKAINQNAGAAAPAKGSAR
ncbi:hypothetical protein ACP70R_002470 [Stipagrostis hirtigluma subsp. patula]